MAMELMTRLADILTATGAAIVNAGDIRCLPAELRQSMPVGICVGVALQPQIIRGIVAGPTPAYYEEYVAVNDRVSALAHDAAVLLRDAGHTAFAQEASVRKLDRCTLATPLPHKTVATLSGTGWIGKCDLLVTRQFGSAIRYATVLTDAPLPVAAPVRKSYCGTCSECVQACPADAPTGRRWELGLGRADLYDAWKCMEKAQQLCTAQGIRGTICGICIAVCPFTKRYLRKLASDL